MEPGAPGSASKNRAEHPSAASMLSKSFLLAACALALILWREPWHGCPGNCSGHGQCLQGVCFCKPQYGGADCSVDSLQLAGAEWASQMDFDLNISDSCSFLSLEDVMVRDDGGGNGSGVVFHGEGGKKIYHVPADVVEMLPETCPAPRWRRCAIVGNSGALRFGSFGTEIDSHEMVLRFNQAPTSGFEQHVGHRTTIESLNTPFARRLVEATAPLEHNGTASATVDSQSVPQRPLWLWRRPMAQILLFEPSRMKEVYVALRKQLPLTKVVMLSPRFTHAVVRLHERLRRQLRQLGLGCMCGEKPMSGFFAVVMALRACDEVDLYGFDAWQDDMAGIHLRRYHYFDSEEPRASAHSYELTYYTYALMELSQRHSLRLRRVQSPTAPNFGGTRHPTSKGALMEAPIQSKPLRARRV